MVFPGQVHCLDAVRGDGDDFHVVDGCQHQAGVAARFLHIVGDQHP